MTQRNTHSISPLCPLSFAASIWGQVGRLVRVGSHQRWRSASMHCCVSSVSELRCWKHSNHRGHNVALHVCVSVWVCVVSVHIPRTEAWSLKPPHLSSCVRMWIVFPSALPTSCRPPLHTCRPSSTPQVPLSLSLSQTLALAAALNLLLVPLLSLCLSPFSLQQARVYTPPFTPC